MTISFSIIKFQWYIGAFVVVFVQYIGQWGPVHERFLDTTAVLISFILRPISTADVQADGYFACN